MSSLGSRLSGTPGWWRRGFGSPSPASLEPDEETDDEYSPAFAAWALTVTIAVLIGLITVVWMLMAL